MGFKNTLKNCTVSEWKDYYVDYEELLESAHKKDFKMTLENQLKKINDFYFLLENKANNEKIRIFEGFNYEIDQEYKREPAHTEHASNSEHDRFTPKNTTSTTSEEESTAQMGAFKGLLLMPETVAKRRREKHVTEFLHSLIKIKSYKEVNLNGLSRLAKRYDENFPYEKFTVNFAKKMETSYISQSKRIDGMQKQVKRMYKKLFAQNELQAKQVFSRIKRGIKSSDLLYTLSGFIIGCCSIYTLNVKSKEYLAIFNILFGFFLFGLCVKIFKEQKINYKFIFNFDICSLLNNARYMASIACFMTVNILFYKFGPDLLLKFAPLINLAVFCCPLHIFFYTSRLYLSSVYLRVGLIPWTSIKFRHFYFADVAQSFKYSLKTFLSMAGITNDWIIFSFLSYLILIRIIQCLRRFKDTKNSYVQILNSLKYFLSFIFSFVSFIVENNISYIPKYLYTGIGIIATLTSIIWDLTVDWAITRRRFLYYKPLYAFIIAFSIYARLGWYFLKNSPFEMAIIENLRRFLWTLIRVEVEHLNNCDKLRVHTEINLTAGELFYKKDQNLEYQIVTETEGENESSYIDSNDDSSQI